jgi:hypothetical protein
MIDSLVCKTYLLSCANEWYALNCVIIFAQVRYRSIWHDKSPRERGEPTCKVGLGPEN